MPRPKRVYVACDTRGDVLLTNTNLKELRDDVSKYRIGRSIVIYDYELRKEVVRIPPKKD